MEREDWIDDRDPVRRRALARCARFLGDELPGVLRRIVRWKGDRGARMREFVDEVRHELVLDALEHAALVAELPDSELRQRWFRLTHRRHYRFASRALSAELDELPGRDGAEGTAPDLPAEERDLLHAIAERGAYLRNGRINVVATARELGVSRHRVRGVWLATRERCGAGERAARFWRRRLAEALLHLAACSLRDAGLVRTFSTARPATQQHCRRRLRRIRATLHAAMQPADVRRAMAIAARRAVDPREALAAAAELAPGDPNIRLWAFEAFHAYGDHARAAAELRAARRCGAEPVRTVLARARLLEARGRIGAARELLRRGVRRHGRDPRLRASLAAASDSPGPSRPPSRRCGG